MTLASERSAVTSMMSMGLKTSLMVIIRKGSESTGNIRNESPFALQGLHIMKILSTKLVHGI